MDTVHILIVEDDHDIAYLIALHLREVGYRVDTVHDGETGFERASSGHYDLIVLDVVLPKLSGTELCQRLRAGANYTLILISTLHVMPHSKVPLPSGQVRARGFL